jgi:hypothetical protein
MAATEPAFVLVNNYAKSVMVPRLRVVSSSAQSVALQHAPTQHKNTNTFSEQHPDQTWIPSERRVILFTRVQVKHVTPEHGLNVPSLKQVEFTGTKNLGLQPP